MPCHGNASAPPGEPARGLLQTMANFAKWYRLQLQTVCRNVLNGWRAFPVRSPLGAEEEIECIVCTGKGTGVGWYPASEGHGYGRCVCALLVTYRTVHDWK